MNDYTSQDSLLFPPTSRQSTQQNQRFEPHTSFHRTMRDMLTSILQRPSLKQLCLDMTMIDSSPIAGELQEIVSRTIEVVHNDKQISQVAFRNAPLDVMTSILMAFPKERLESIQMDLSHENNETMMDMILSSLSESLKRHATTLETLGLTGLTRKMLSSMTSLITKLPRIKNLCLSGSIKNKLIMASPADMAMLATILRIPTIVSVTLDGYCFTTKEAVQSFIDILGSSDIQALKIGENNHFPEDSLPSLARALAISKLRELDFDSSVSLDFLFAFRKALTQMQTMTSLERLSFKSSSGTLDLVCQETVGCHRLFGRLDASWRDPVLKLLKHNRRKRICPLLFDAVGTFDVKEARERKLMEALEAADVDILYDQLCRNPRNLQGILWQAVNENRD